MSKGRESFPKDARLTRRSEFLRLSRARKKAYTPHFIVIRQGNDNRGKRLGITVSARVGNAVVRNRMKRIVREFFRRQRDVFGPNEDTLIIARRGAGELSTPKACGELRAALGSRARRNSHASKS